MRRTLGLGIAIALAALAALAPGAPAQASDHPGCALDADGYVCAWRIDTTEVSVAAPNEKWLAFPAWPESLATITVQLDGRDAGWALYVLRYPGGYESGEPVVTLARSEHAPSADAGSFHVETYVHVISGEPADQYALLLRYGHVEAQGVVLRNAAPSVGEFRVSYRGEKVPEGVAPERPAATRDDPHIADVPRDTRTNASDLLAVWFDDPRLGDGLFDVNVAVSALDSLDIQRDATGFGYLIWVVPFTVPIGSFELWFFAEEDDPASIGCNLRRVAETSRPIVGFPRCAVDVPRGELRASVPEGVVGNPGPGVEFGLGQPYVFTSQMAQPITEDIATEARYGFALGGPDVWHALNPRLTPDDAAPAAWYEAPMARENLPDTIGVASAVFTLLGVALGLLVVRRSRRTMRELLDRIDRIERAHESDARMALLELGRLESDLTADFRSGRLKESAYHLAVQRIAAVATRIALRRDLGLDDGEPGAAVTPRMQLRLAPDDGRRAP